MSLGILGKNIKSLSQTVTDLWEISTLAHKIQKWEYSDLNFGMPLQIIKGVHKSDIGPLGPVAWICAAYANGRMDGQMKVHVLTDVQTDAGCLVMWSAKLKSNSPLNSITKNILPSMTNIKNASLKIWHI